MKTPAMGFLLLRYPDSFESALQNTHMPNAFPCGAKLAFAAQRILALPVEQQHTGAARIRVHRNFNIDVACKGLPA
jgi:hypothetical protein